MSELDWQPLANVSQHADDRCWRCNEYCSPSDPPCRCCLEADLSDHKSAVAKLGERVFIAENAIANVLDVMHDKVISAEYGPDAELVPAVTVSDLLTALGSPQ